MSNGVNVVDQSQPDTPDCIAEFFQPDFARSFMQYHDTTFSLESHTWAGVKASFN